MTIELALLMLFAAALNASWNALIKVSGDRIAVMVAISIVASVLAAILLPFAGVPDPASLQWLPVAIALHVGYLVLLPLAYNYGDLGQIYPIARGSSPLIVTLGAFIFVGEVLDPIPLLGVACLTVGVMTLACDRGTGFAQNRRGVGLALLTGAFVAAYTIVDGIGARASGNALAFALWLKVGDGLVIFLLFAPWKRAAIMEAFRKSAPAVGLFGGVQILTYCILLYALSRAPFGVVAALRETSVLFAALISTFWLKEGFGVWRFASAGLVFAGIILSRYKR